MELDVSQVNETNIRISEKVDPTLSKKLIKIDDSANFNSELRLLAALKREETANELMDRRRTSKLQALVMISALFKTFVIATL